MYLRPELVAEAGSSNTGEGGGVERNRGRAEIWQCQISTRQGKWNGAAENWWFGRFEVEYVGCWKNEDRL
jgi:hypothetical protein